MYYDNQFGGAIQNGKSPKRKDCQGQASLRLLTLIRQPVTRVISCACMPPVPSRLLTAELGTTILPRSYKDFRISNEV